MKLVVDTHAHTLSSGHAYSTLDEMVRAASEKGLEAIAITDHSPGMPGGPHLFHFANLKIVPQMMHGVRVLRGAEANIVSYEGEVDLPEEILEGLDMAIASLHPPCIDFADQETLTTCLEKVMQNPYINIIGHPGDSRYPLDMKRIAKASKETGTLLEVNVASLKPTSYRPGVRENLVELLTICKEEEVPIIIGTDAHITYEVGEFKEAIELLESLDFPMHLVMNTDVEKLLSYFSQKRLK